MKNINTIIEKLEQLKVNSGSGYGLKYYDTLNDLFYVLNNPTLDVTVIKNNITEYKENRDIKELAFIMATGESVMDTNELLNIINPIFALIDDGKDGENFDYWKEVEIKADVIREILWSVGAEKRLRDTLELIGR